MKEAEKRAGLGLDEALRLKGVVDARFTRTGCVRRSSLVKVDNADFSPGLDSVVDVKVKLIDGVSLLSVKHGSWHGDTAREEHETRFDRADLGDLLASLRLLGHTRYLVLATVRTTWTAPGLVVTLDEHTKLGKALFEIELDGADLPETLIDDAFAGLGLTPMDSAQTIAFVAGLNEAEDIRLDLTSTSPAEAARAVVEAHQGAGTH